MKNKTSEKQYKAIFIATIFYVPVISIILSIWLERNVIIDKQSIFPAIADGFTAGIIMDLLLLLYAWFILSANAVIRENKQLNVRIEILNTSSNNALQLLKCNSLSECEERELDFELTYLKEFLWEFYHDMKKDKSLYDFTKLKELYIYIQGYVENYEMMEGYKINGHLLSTLNVIIELCYEVFEAK